MGRKPTLADSHGSPALRVTAVETGVATFDLDQRRCSALRALRHGLAGKTSPKGTDPHWLREEAREMPFDDVSDRREE